MAGKLARAAGAIALGAVALLLPSDHSASGAAAEAIARRNNDGARLDPAAVRRLLEEAGPAGYSAAFDLLESPQANLRAGAALFLGHRRSRLAVDPLLGLLRDPHPIVRRAAAEALGLIGERRALPFLQRAIGDPDPPTAEAALHAARRLRGNDAQSSSLNPLKLIGQRPSAPSQPGP